MARGDLSLGDSTLLDSTHLPRIAVIVGSNRRDINRKLAQAPVRLGANKFDASFARIDDLPMYNKDNEGNLRPKWCASKTNWRAPTAC